MSRYAQDTSVSTDRSIAEVRSTIRRYGATEFAHMEGDREARVVFTMRDRQVMFRLTMPDPKAKEFTETPARGTKRTPQQAEAAWEQACRSRWRALALVVKARLEAVESGIETFEEAFLAHIIMPGSESMTVYDKISQPLALAYQQNAPVPLLGPPRST